MKLLLIEDVEMLGWLGDIVDVKSGYARNYLVPQGLAVVPTQAGIDALAEEKARRGEMRNLEFQEKEQLAASIEGAEVVLAANANELGHLFGSVAERDVAENLRQQGFAVQDAMVRMPDGHIKDLGTLEKLLTNRGKIFSRKRSGNCAGCQRKVKTAIKRARFMALLPFTN